MTRLRLLLHVPRLFGSPKFTIAGLVVVVFILSRKLPVCFPPDTSATEMRMMRAYNKHDNRRSSANNASSNNAPISVCEFPEIDPFEPSVMEIAGLQEKTIRCEGTHMPDLTYITSTNELTINISKVGEYMEVSSFQHCSYRHVFRYATNDNYVKYSNWSLPFKDRITLPKGTEFLMVECKNYNSEVVSKTFYCLIPRHGQYNSKDYLNFKKRQGVSAPKETLNVIMIGLDTIASNQFIRACNKTYSYLTNTLQSFNLIKHSQLGRDTFTNLLPLFAGQSYHEISQWWSDDHELDNVDFIWQTFEQAGYVTLFTEDWPEVGAFNYEKKGFRNPFARYNTRPLNLAMSIDMALWEYSAYCAGNQVEMNFLLDYVSRCLDTFPDKPVFAVAMFTKPTHDYPTHAKMFDDHLLHFFESLNQKGHLKNTLLVTFSDHGVRWGPLRDSVNGFVESRTPLTILTFPDWFLKKYPDVAANLEANAKSLTSHFDTHATLLDLLYFKTDTPPPLSPLRHGLSLLGKIPWDRTCKDAHIPLDFCLCGYKGVENIGVTSELSKLLANLVLNALNLKTDKYICAVLTVYHIIRVLKIDINYSSNTNNETVLYQVKLETIPGNGVFEANVHSRRNATDFRVGDNIERLNLYRGQADCMNIAMNKQFCYCNNLISV